MCDTGETFSIQCQMQMLPYSTQFATFTTSAQLGGGGLNIPTTFTRTLCNITKWTVMEYTHFHTTPITSGIKWPNTQSTHQSRTSTYDTDIPAAMGTLGVAMLQAMAALLVTPTAVGQANPCQRADTGLSYHCPAASCVDVFREPGRYDGYYWVKPVKGAREVYCVKRPSNCGSEGVWMRVGHINTGYKNVICPGNLLTWVYNRKMYCRTLNSSGCASVIFQTNGARYTEVCGMVRGYQYHSTDAMYRHRPVNTPDDNYVDGVSFTYGASPRKHLWAYAVGVSADLGIRGHLSHCPCSSPHAGQAPPPFVGSNYYCETAHRNGFPNQILYASSPLWDGRGICEGTCCDNPNMPWFRVVLSGSTTDKPEMRLCADTGFAEEAVAIDYMELYIRVG